MGNTQYQVSQAVVSTSKLPAPFVVVHEKYCTTKEDTVVTLVLNKKSFPDLEIKNLKDNTAIFKRPSKGADKKIALHDINDPEQPILYATSTSIVSFKYTVYRGLGYTKESQQQQLFTIDANSSGSKIKVLLTIGSSTTMVVVKCTSEEGAIFLEDPDAITSAATTCLAKMTQQNQKIHIEIAPQVDQAFIVTLCMIAMDIQEKINQAAAWAACRIS